MAAALSLTSRDYEKISEVIQDFISSCVAGASAKGVVLGLSGGLDSSVVAKLCVLALGKKRVLGLVLPAKATPEKDVDDAAMLAKKLGIKYKTIGIQPVIDGFMQSLPADKKAQGNLAARVRMSILYHHAYVNRYLVAGTSDKSELYVGYFCYDEKTRALTKDGFKAYDQLKPGDTVFSLNVSTGQVRECPVKDVHVFDYRGKLFHFDSKAVDIMVTPGHKMLTHTRTHKGIGRMCLRPVEECLRRRITIFPVPKPWQGVKSPLPKSYLLEFHQKNKPRTARIAINDLFYLFGLFIGDGCCYLRKETVPVRTLMDKAAYLSSMNRNADGTFARLLTESPSAGYQKSYDVHEVFFALHENSKHEARSKLVSLLDYYQIDFSTTKTVIRILSKEFYSLFSPCGIYARNKRIPKWILQYPAENLIWLYKGLKDSDGSHTEKVSLYYTTSHQLAADYVELLIKLGKLGTWKVRPGKTSRLQSGKLIHSGPRYQISNTNVRATRSFPNKKIKQEDYDGIVWCPEIPDTHNLLVERNGKLAFCGNSKYGDGGNDLAPIADLYKTQVRALGRFLDIPQDILEKKSSPRLWKGHLAEKELGIEYETLDPILHLLVDKKMNAEKAAQKLGVPVSQVRQIWQMVSKSAHKRDKIPICFLKKTNS